MKKLTTLIVLATLCLNFSVKGQVKSTQITGTILDSGGKGINGATISSKMSGQVITSDTKGTFKLKTGINRDVLKISHVGYATLEIEIDRSKNIEPFTIVLSEGERSLNEVQILSTGYQSIPKERATGSFEQVNKSLLERRISSNILEKLENVASGFYTNHTERSRDKISIRGRSTIFAESSPLIILNNFPYEGNINQINPNDIENVTILKDAAAASIWGARAGNGVIVITTKKGSGDKATIQFNSSINLLGRPKIDKLPLISSRDFVQFEKQLFGLGYYKSDESRITAGFLFPPFTPVIELLRAERDRKISPENANSQIEALTVNNVNDDIKRHLYQNSISKINSISLSGNSKSLNYYVSTGYDNSIASLVGQNNSRFSFRSQNIIKISEKFKIDAAINYAQSKNEAGNNAGYSMSSNGKQFYSYAKLASTDGSSLPIDWNYTRSFIDGVESKGLLNWEYRPLDEINRRQLVNINRDLLINTGLDYKLSESLSLQLKYQNLNSTIVGENNQNSDSFYTRDLINNFTQINNGVLSRPIPLGNILNKNTLESLSHQGRAQINFNKDFSDKHTIAAIAGWEIRSLSTKGSSATYYGYNDNGSVVSNALDYSKPWQQLYYGTRSKTSFIPNSASISGTTDRYLSNYLNVSYQYKGRYSVSASARNDASNLFGVKTNQKEVPLWSAGLAWAIAKEPFYQINWLTDLKLRATYGSQGNVSKKASAYSTATYTGYSLNTGLLSMQIETPPNGALKWETISQFNVGLDFNILNNTLYGSVEFYQKHGKDLLGSAPLDPTTGMAINDAPPYYFGNLAGIKGQGVDLKLDANVLNKNFKWQISALYSYTKTVVSKYSEPSSNYGNLYLSDFLINPVIGKSIYTMYAYPWAGLDPTNGNPRGLINGMPSVDYNTIINQTPLTDMKAYSAQPTSFGSLRNNFRYKGFEFSFNVSFRLGYYFRNASIDYGQLAGSWSGHSDYAKRWKNPGDELLTNVPSFSYPISNLRDNFYTYSDALIQKADNIKLEDVTMNYSIDNKNLKRWSISRLVFSMYLSNLENLWTANKIGIDPNFVYSPQLAKSLSFGISATF